MLHCAQKLMYAFPMYLCNCPVSITIISLVWLWKLRVSKVSTSAKVSWLERAEAGVIGPQDVCLNLLPAMFKSPVPPQKRQYETTRSLLGVPVCQQVHRPKEKGTSETFWRLTQNERYYGFYWNIQEHHVVNFQNYPYIIYLANYILCKFN